jgi:SAM-dependent methyltransferase
MNRAGVRLQAAARSLVRFMNAHTSDARSDYYTRGLPGLHRRIQDILDRQRNEYPHYVYFYGQPYQALGILGVFGERGTEERFEEFGVAKYVGPDDYVLDIGCNCGFLAILAAFRTGCRAHGIDVNPYMIEIGEECATFLRLSGKVQLEAADFHYFKGTGVFSRVFSCATHWTDDGLYRVNLEQHLGMVHRALTAHGILFFESHANDLLNPDFPVVMQSVEHLYELLERKYTDRNTRELYILRKR